MLPKGSTNFVQIYLNIFYLKNTNDSSLWHITVLALAILGGTQGDQMIWKKLPNIFWKVAKTDAKPNNAKIQTIFTNSLFSWKCNKL